MFANSKPSTNEIINQEEINEQSNVYQTALIGSEIEEANHRGELCLPQIARYTFGLPNADFSSRLVRGKVPLRPFGQTQKILEDKDIEGKAKRARPFAYTFRATEEEKNLIDNKLKQSGLTMTDFIIRSITDKPVIVVDDSGEILAELKRQGNNLNQAVKNNYFGNATEREIISAVEECKRVYRKLSSAIGGE